MPHPLPIPGRLTSRRPVLALALAGILVAGLAAGLVASLAGTALAAGSQTGFPLPRFVSLRSSEVNLRTGPGSTYPIEWVYLRRHMPVEVIAEFDNWRKVRDWQGTVGWVHQSLLDGTRYALVTSSEQVLLSQPSAAGALVARLMPGVVAELVACEPEWCRLEAGGYGGWLPRAAFWGAYPHETFD